MGSLTTISSGIIEFWGWKSPTGFSVVGHRGEVFISAAFLLMLHVVVAEEDPLPAITKGVACCNSVTQQILPLAVPSQTSVELE